MLRRHLVAWVVAVFGTGTAAAAAAGAVGEGREARTFTNPIVAKGADPWVVRWEGAWYRAHSGGGAVSVSRFEALEEMGKAEARRVWVPEPGREYSRNLWAPEIHHLDGRWHLYVAADDGRNENHRMYVLEGDARDPQAPYQWRGRMAARTDRWAIDGTILSLPDGRRYFVWSGWEGTENVAQHLYLARLNSAVSIDGERVCISTPEHPWERHGQPWVNEGPQVLWRGERLFLVYSASGSWTDDYCLGLLEWTGGDPMDAASWRKVGTPLFSKTAQVFGPGHCCFVTSPDGVETWIVYHSARTKGSGWDRQISMQPLGWDTEGRPQLGEPVAPGRPLALPSWSRALRPSPSSASPPPDGARVP